MTRRSRIRHLVSSILAVLLGAGLVVATPAGAVAAPAATRTASAPALRNLRFIPVMQAAGSVLGHPYRRGGAAPGGFDCSGFVRWSFARAGVSLPHSSRAQRAATVPIAAHEAISGDLVFFGNPVHHVGIYMGDGLMIHASSSAGVRTMPVAWMGSAPSYARVK